MRLSRIILWVFVAIGSSALYYYHPEVDLFNGFFKYKQIEQVWEQCQNDKIDIEFNSRRVQMQVCHQKHSNGRWLKSTITHNGIWYCTLLTTVGSDGIPNTVPLGINQKLHYDLFIKNPITEKMMYREDI